MLKLYYSPGACSLSPHIALHEAGLAHEIEKVDLKAKTTEHGEDYWKINPRGYVPALRLEDGSMMGEGPALVQYIADQAPQKHLAPKWGSMERYRLMEWLTFVSTELHKGFGPIFGNAPDEVQNPAREKLARRFGTVEEHLTKNGPYLLGKDFSVADGYLFTVMRWALAKKVAGVAEMPALAKFMETMRARPGVQRALAAEGLPQ